MDGMIQLGNIQYLSLSEGTLNIVLHVIII